MTSRRLCDVEWYLGRVWKELVMAFFKVLSWYSGQNNTTTEPCDGWYLSRLELGASQVGSATTRASFQFHYMRRQTKVVSLFCNKNYIVLHVLCMHEVLPRSSHLIICLKDPNYSVCSYWYACSANWTCMNQYRFCSCVWLILQFLRDASYSVAHYRVLLHCVTGIKTNTSTLTGGETHNCL